jgi:hypothetical protein
LYRRTASGVRAFPARITNKGERRPGWCCNM